MLKTDRGKYASRNPYHDCPQSIGYNATISAPHMHAYALESLEPYLQPGMRALDIGSGSGYLAAVMARMVGHQGKVVGIEHVQPLVDASKQNVQQDDASLLENGVLTLVVGDGRQGYAPMAPYDCIHVGAAYDEHPETLIQQLKAPGRMFIPLERASGEQSIVVFDKDEQGNVTSKHLMGVMYVPLTSVQDQLGR